MPDELLENLSIKTTERTVKLGNEIVCSWREGIDRGDDNKPVAIVDINNSGFLEEKSWEELTKKDAVILGEALRLLIKDIEEYGL